MEEQLKPQLSLDLQTVPLDEIDLRFNAFHKANPHIYRYLVRFTREALAERVRRGSSRYCGIKAVVERVRWHVDYEVADHPAFQINNDFTARYARLIMQQESDLRGVFHTRKLVAETRRQSESYRDFHQPGDTNEEHATH